MLVKELSEERKFAVFQKAFLEYEKNLKIRFHVVVLLCIFVKCPQ